MEFHISRDVRRKYDVKDSLFSYTGNVIFANLAASRELATRVNEVRRADVAPEEAMHAAALFAMGLIDELSHAMIAQYRATRDPGVLAEAIRWFGERQNEEQVEKLLRTFTGLFPNTPIYRGQLTVEQWLNAVTEHAPNREAAFEELILVWLANVNPAFAPFREFFNDQPLRDQTVYAKVTPEFGEYFATRPLFTPEEGTLLDVLRAPMLASPDSLGGQLAYIREKWVDHLGPDVRQILLAIDVLKEEDIAIWMRFHPPSASKWHEHKLEGWGSEGFLGNEFVGFGHGRAGTGGTLEPVVHEYEAFSPDTDWMPNVVLIAKSTYVWLEQLSKKYGRHIQRLDQIPDEELKILADRGLNGLWLIGLWERSAASQTIKRLRGQHDAVASAYSLRDYAIAEDLGGYLAYTNLRDRAMKFGIRLASDMVPNHMGIDSNWLIEHPEWFLSRSDSPYPVYSFNGPDVSTDSRVEIKIEDHYYDQTDAAVVFRRRDRASGHTEYVYHGNDGTTFAWNDTAQLDYSKAVVREQVIQTILSVARQFPIIRFDAAMTLAKKHVQRLWFPLPGSGGSIPSRAEFSMTNEEFDALMPNEFWREVVDRVAAEVPGTLLLAEAFWLLEGYFVRTLGMHRVYNSAFMNMLRDEENAKYRSYLKKTIEFDPEILKRYVNFMSNPDERTAIDQFGTGDKYFGTCSLLATLPGLPMLGHGQIEAFTEKYGMEYKRARYDETPNEDLVARHMREIAPLLKNRAVFAESTYFALYDFWVSNGTVDENVFVYSNRLGEQRALILFNNRYGETRGTVHHSVAMMDKWQGVLVQKALHDALALPSGETVLAYEDTATGLKYLRRAGAIEEQGFSIHLHAYQYAVLQHWRVMVPTAAYPWDRLCDVLEGAGVYNLDEALSRLRLRPVHDALKRMLSPVILEPLIEAAEEAEDHPTAKDDHRRLHPESRGVETAIAAIVKQAVEFCEQAIVLDHDASARRTALEPPEPENFRKALQAAARLPRVMNGSVSDWPATARVVLPSNHSRKRASAVWAPVIAWSILRFACDGSTTADAKGPKGAEAGSVDVHARKSEDAKKTLAFFEEFQLRTSLAENFARLGLEGEDAWRAAARVRLLLSGTYKESGFADEVGSDELKPAVASGAGSAAKAFPAFFQEPDVRWLLGVNESEGTVYFNKECLEEIFWWVQLPKLISLLERGGPSEKRAVDPQELLAIKQRFSAIAAMAAKSGFKLKTFLAALTGVEERIEIPSEKGEKPVTNVAKLAATESPEKESVTDTNVDEPVESAVKLES